VGNTQLQPLSLSTSQKLDEPLRAPGDMLVIDRFDLTILDRKNGFNRQAQPWLAVERILRDPRRSIQDIGGMFHIVWTAELGAQHAEMSPDKLNQAVRSYCQYRRNGPLGTGEVNVTDRSGGVHVFTFETFSNTYDCLTMGTYKRPHARVVGF
jgi:hypothetical protein